MKAKVLSFLWISVLAKHLLAATGMLRIKPSSSNGLAGILDAAEAKGTNPLPRLFALALLENLPDAQRLTPIPACDRPHLAKRLGSLPPIRDVPLTNEPSIRHICRRLRTTASR
jgi:hypothetical protein